jgi:Tfp pilus assembly protein PilX
VAAAALAYREARHNGVNHNAAMHAAEASLREQWPELSAKEASAEAVAAIAYASSHHLGCGMEFDGPAHPAGDMKWRYAAAWRRNVPIILFKSYPLGPYFDR